jgi:hypothetical protein
VTLSDESENSDQHVPRQSSYRAVSTLAVTSIVTGTLSLLVVFDWTFSAIPLVGIGLGALALHRIHGKSDQITGAGLAKVGIGLSLILGGLGYSWLALARAAEVPSGYTAVAYSDLAPDPDKPQQQIPPQARQYAGKKVFIKGYMYPGRLQYGIKKFVMSRDNGYCKFCMPNPRPTDLIEVTMAGDQETRYTRKLIRIGGKLEVEEEGAIKPGHAAYRLQADYLRW